MRRRVAAVGGDRGVAVGLSGAVYLLEQTPGGAWTAATQIQEPIDTWGTFGHSVAMAEGLLLVGDPDDAGPYQTDGYAFLYDADDATLLDTFEPIFAPDWQWAFGAAVALDRHSFVVGEPEGSFVRDGQTHWDVGIANLWGLDPDGDGINSWVDNCRDTANPDQTDGDSDGLGDACDPDRDDDGLANEADNCPDAANPGQWDVDGDGTGNVCDDTVSLGGQDIAAGPLPDADAPVNGVAIPSPLAAARTPGRGAQPVRTDAA